MDRKDSHLHLCLTEPIDFSSENINGFSDLRFDHDALPELDRADVDTSIVLFGKKLAAPLIVGAMTGGTDRATEINRRLALAAEKTQVGFALGSQRKILESPNVQSSFEVRKLASNIPLLFGNLGAVQLNYGVGIIEVRRLIDIVQADAFFLHLNPLQEIIQPEGNINFSNLAKKIENVCREISIPILIKEVGAGISKTTAEKLSRLSIAGIEIAGLGGTSWAKIEGLRAVDSIQSELGKTFSRWGVPTAQSILICRQAFGNRVVIGSGGIRNGIEVAKALVLGADACAIALPFLKAAEQSTEAVVQAIQNVVEELKTVMFLTGSQNIAELHRRILRNVRDFTHV